MGINNSMKSKEYEDYTSQLKLFRNDYNSEFSTEISIYVKEDSLDPDELIIIREQLFDDETHPVYVNKKKQIERRKVKIFKYLLKTKRLMYIH